MSELGYEIRRPLADALRDNVRELRARSGTVQYRMLYFFIGKNRVAISHGITKEGDVPDSEIDRAVQNKELIETDAEKHITEFEF